MRQNLPTGTRVKKRFEVGKFYCSEILQRLPSESTSEDIQHAKKKPIQSSRLALNIKLGTEAAKVGERENILPGWGIYPFGLSSIYPIEVQDPVKNIVVKGMTRTLGRPKAN